MSENTIDYNRIFSSIPEITGLDFKKKGNDWVGGFYITGENHTTRSEKTVCYMSSGCAFLHEQGGESMSLIDWLLRYGGASDISQAMDILKGYSGTSFPTFEARQLPFGMYIPDEEVAKIEKRYFGSLFKFLCTKFNPKDVRRVFREYRVGVIYETAVYWYINEYGKVCMDNRVKYADDGHRMKDFPPYRKFKKDDGFTNTCLFGAHIRGAWKQTIIVESEKTALIAAIKYPMFRFLATGGMAKIHQCAGKDYILCPDYHPKAISSWSNVGKIWEWYKDKNVELNSDLGDLIISEL